MTEHRALVVAIPSAQSGPVNGARLRVDDVVHLLATAGFDAQVLTHRELLRTGQHGCLGVAVSYASAASVRLLRRRTTCVWLDAMDSWLLVNGSGIRYGHPSYGVRLLRDAARLGTMPRPDLVTHISRADAGRDRWTVRGGRRLVLPGRTDEPVELLPQGPRRRVVLTGDWGYPPNRDGLGWFRAHVLPALAGVGADIVVFGPGAEPVTSAALVVRGYVGDARQMYRQGDVHVAPVRFGGGVKRKVLQPLLAGLPVVATTAAAHGLRRHPLLDVRDDPAAFAAAIRGRLAAPHIARPQPAGEVLDGDDAAQVLRWLKQVAVRCAQDDASTCS